MRDHARHLRRHSGSQALLLMLLCLQACRDEPRSQLQVRMVVPDSGPGTGTAQNPQRLFLNSKVTVYFTQELDPLSVTSDTVRLVKLSGERRGIVRLRDVTVASRSVCLEPEPPLTPGLQDGSLQPDQLYRLEIVGLPLTNTVTSLTGKPLPRHHLRYFRTVTATAKETDLPHPFLPPLAPGKVLQLRPGPLQMAAERGRLELHFNLPLVPATVRPQAFEVHRVRKTTGSERLELASTQVVSRPRPLDPYPGCTVRLVFADTDAVQFGDLVYVLVKSKDGVRDYRDRTFSDTGGGFRRVWVHRGQKTPLLRLPVSGPPLRFRPVSPSQLSFECAQGKWIQPLARQETGDGRHGIFHPKESMVLEPGKPFNRGDGQVRATGPALNFQAVHIPKGVTVTLRSERRVQLRALGEMRIEGVLQLDTPVPQGRPRERDLHSPKAVCAYAPVALVAAGSVHISGSIQRHPGEQAAGAPLAVLANDIQLEGRIPFDTILAVPRRAHVTGPAQSATVVELRLQAGLPSDTRLQAEARTEWHRLPVNFSGRVRARAEDVQGDIEVFLQVAAPDPVDPNRPYLDPSALPRPLRCPMAEPFEVPQGAYVRFLLRAPVEGGALLPRLRALVVEAE